MGLQSARWGRPGGNARPPGLKPGPRARLPLTLSACTSRFAGPETARSVRAAHALAQPYNLHLPSRPAGRGLLAWKRSSTERQHHTAARRHRLGWPSTSINLFARHVHDVMPACMHEPLCHVAVEQLLRIHGGRRVRQLRRQREHPAALGLLTNPGRIACGRRACVVVACRR